MQYIIGNAYRGIQCLGSNIPERAKAKYEYIITKRIQMAFSSPNCHKLPQMSHHIFGVLTQSYLNTDIINASNNQQISAQ